MSVGPTGGKDEAEWVGMGMTMAMVRIKICAEMESWMVRASGMRMSFGIAVVGGGGGDSCIQSGGKTVQPCFFEINPLRRSTHSIRESRDKCAKRR